MQRKRSGVDATKPFGPYLRICKLGNYFGFGKIRASVNKQARSTYQNNLYLAVGSNLALGLVTSCYGCKTVCWRPACCWLRCGSTSTGDPIPIKVIVKKCCVNCPMTGHSPQLSTQTFSVNPLSTVPELDQKQYNCAI